MITVNSPDVSEPIWHLTTEQLQSLCEALLFYGNAQHYRKDGFLGSSKVEDDRGLFALTVLKQFYESQTGDK